MAVMSSAESRSIHITDFVVDKTHVEPGEAFTVAMMATGNANFGIRQNREPGQSELPGWKSHGPRYAFIPSSDFLGPGPYKNAHICHKDNGALDQDRREGVFAIEVDTEGWPEATYSLTVMASNRPALGGYLGDTRDFQITVGAVQSHTAADRLGKHVAVFLNGELCTTGREDYPIYPGRPNRLTVKCEVGKLPEAGYSLALVRLMPDGRQGKCDADLAAVAPEVTLDLGLFAVPAVFEYEAGVVYRRGYRLRLVVVDRASSREIEEFCFYQTTDANGSAELLRVGDEDRVVHYHGPRGGKHGKPMDPPILLRLSNEVLSDPDDVRILYRLRTKEARLRPELSLTSISGVLRVTREHDRHVMSEQEVEVRAPVKVQKLDVSKWEEGAYRIAVLPQVEGTGDHEGPSIVYRRHPSRDTVPLSPLAPWAFQRDAGRPEVPVTDFGKAVAEWSDGLPEGTAWQLQGKRLVTVTGDWKDVAVVLRPRLRGWYAVFAYAERGCCYIRVSKRGIPRGIGYGLCFVEAADLTDEEIAIYPAIRPGSGLRELRLVPVTAASAERVLQQAANPPRPLIGVADWCDYFHPPPGGHSAGGRLAEDQFDALLRGHAEVGLRTIAWAIGRSWVEYGSKLPQTTRFPCAPLENLDPEIRQRYAGRAHMVNAYCPLTSVLERRSKYGINIYPWLAMQRHYGEKAYGGIFASKWFRSHREWWRWSKNASGPTGAVVCYYFPEVRKERVDILCEVAEKSPNGIVVGCCRQVPMLLYRPEMVAAYKKLTGVDPQKIDATNREQYEHWIRWRANFFTETLRELHRRLVPIRAKTGKPIPVSVRVPSKGLFYNLAQGLDVAAWCQEKLVDRIQLDPLEDCEGRGCHDARPYVELCHTHGIEVYGGIGNAFWNYAAIYRRALGLLEAGVNGIELYESNNQAVLTQQRWVVPLFGNADLIREFLASSNIEACYPIWARNAAAGHDNHSFGSGGWSVFGMGSYSL